MKRTMQIVGLVAILILVVTSTTYAMPDRQSGPGSTMSLPKVKVAGTAAPGQPVLVSGKAGSAYYAIIVPPNWNRDLVIWNHGFSFTPPAPVDPNDPNSIGPLASLQLAEGYAVAASSLRQDGWAVFHAKNDLQSLMGVFKGKFGAPKQVWLYGGSLGGIVTAQAIEEVHIGKVVGALSLCGAVAGSRNWDGALDLRLIYDLVCANTPAAAIPGGATGLPEGYQLTDDELRARVNACTGFTLPPAMRSATQNANYAAIVGILRLPQVLLATYDVPGVYQPPFFDSMKYSTVGMSNLVFDPQKLAGQLGTGNANVNYNDQPTTPISPLVNASIERVSPNPGAAQRLGMRYTPTGAVGNTKIISMHTDKDPVVIVENESVWASVVPPANLTTAIAVEDIPTHCGFKAAEVVAGWEMLRGWVAGAPQPTAAQIQGACMVAAANPLTPGPCRIVPTYVVGNMDLRIRPR